jgi:hypothetical protein
MAEKVWGGANGVDLRLLDLMQITGGQADSCISGMICAPCLI